MNTASINMLGYVANVLFGLVSKNATASHKIFRKIFAIMCRFFWFFLGSPPKKTTKIGK